MDNNQRKILEMLADKKISVEEAERLMSLLKPENGGQAGSAGETKQAKSLPKYLRVEVKPNTDNPEAPQDRVNIRVPLALVRAGMKLGSIIPPTAYNQVDSALKEKGIEFDWRNIKPENLEEFLACLNDLEVDVHNGQQTVHIYAE